MKTLFFTTILKSNQNNFIRQFLASPIAFSAVTETENPGMTDARVARFDSKFRIIEFVSVFAFYLGIALAMYFVLSIFAFALLMYGLPGLIEAVFLVFILPFAYFVNLGFEWRLTIVTAEALLLFIGGPIGFYLRSIVRLPYLRAILS